MLHGGSAVALGIQLGGGAQNARLSRERRKRMRENATHKLSEAYHLDEIAASVATMQSASALEDVANLVLQRDQHDFDARYVHFFHEKIPSRALAESTNLQSLTDIIRHRPSEAAAYRTRGIMQIFKDDLPGAIRDFTDGLGVLRLYGRQHKQDSAPSSAKSLDGPSIVPDKQDEVGTTHSGTEIQLLFHRAGTYLTLACDHIEAALDNTTISTTSAASLADSTQGERIKSSRADSSRLVKTYAKRALRDYLAFLSFLDYSASISNPPEDVPRRLRAPNRRETPVGRQDISPSQPLRRETSQSKLSCQVLQVSTLFSAVAPKYLPSFPPDSSTAVEGNIALAQRHPEISSSNGTAPEASSQEVVTYHPFLTDSLHSVLLCHCLMQTSSKELLRHAYMAARLIRICDGYPIFLAARSPARADWLEVVRRGNNWLGLQGKWENLCSFVSAEGPRPSLALGDGQKSQVKTASDPGKESEVGSIMRKRELKTARDEEEEQRKEYLRAMRKPSGNRKSSQGKRWIQMNDNYFPESAERAEFIARWIKEAPRSGSDVQESSGGKRPKKKQSKPRKVDSNIQQRLSNVHLSEQSQC